MSVPRRLVPRLSQVWIPGGRSAAAEEQDGYSRLIRAGFLRPSHSGVFHMLPLGRRVQEKIEGLVSRHMEDVLGASRVSLSSISSEALWTKSGRLSKAGPELFRFSDRKGVPYLLSPTHEEEITTLVARNIKSYKELPLRLYQITRKYRDEFRPRHGLLRGREFTMKDLYTFDLSVPSALATYEQIRAAYARIFAAMKLPVLVAKASSGDMGGDLSHEYHLPTAIGEDDVVSCDSCDYVANDEVAESVVKDKAHPDSKVNVWRGISRDRETLVNVWYPETVEASSSSASSNQSNRSYADSDIDIYAVKSVVPDLDAGIEDPLSFWSAAISGPKPTAKRLVNIVDCRLLPLGLNLEKGISDSSIWPSDIDTSLVAQLPITVRGTQQDQEINLLRIRNGDHCPKCSSGILGVQKAIELGHTFHLGTRYSEPLEAMVAVPASLLSDNRETAVDAAPKNVPIQMGCHGIGISRIIGAVADSLADERGLNWPAAIAPYSCVIVPGREEDEDDAVSIYHELVTAAASASADQGQGWLSSSSSSLDAVLDDRKETLPRRLTDADMIGIPVIIVLGRDWRASRQVEVQCRRLKFKESVPLNDVSSVVRRLLEQL